ncbi:MAG: hypothetical protein K9H25_13030 [Rhodospirillum sp.]|nr:hypothetical protein [Rhodospirillum sp.]MCF8489286.1 hypothetical protein [Rhodospirillum sp.]MCF8502007.1 hypothetical protein [Rhodospirillum sp.]
MIDRMTVPRFGAVWVVAALCVVQLLSVVPACAAELTADTYRLLDTVPDRMGACTDAVSESYDTGDAEQIRAAMNGEIACLKEVAAFLADTFYAPDAFGPGGITALLQRVSDPLGQMFYVLQTEPTACVPACGSLYGIQALDMYRRFLVTLILDMTERLKDESPVHTE